MASRSALVKSVKQYTHTYMADWPGGRREEFQSVFVKIHTTNGVYGVGEAPIYTRALGDTLGGTIRAIDLIAEAIAGEDTWNLSRLHWKARTVTGSMGGRIPESARAAVDMAIYDILGKLTDQPVHQLLGGGYRTDFSVLGTEFGRTSDDKLSLVAGFISDGYEGLEVKIRIDGTPTSRVQSEKVEALKSVLDAVPATVQVIADMNQRWGSPSAVIKFLSPLAGQYPNLYVEQPTAYADLTGMAQVTNHLDCPVIADESATSPEALVEIARREAANMISVKLARVGGLYPAMKMVTIAENSGIEVRTDTVPNGLIAETATAHLAACIRLPHPVSDGWTWLEPPVGAGGITLEAGRIWLPEDAAGLGVDFDEEEILDESE